MNVDLLPSDHRGEFSGGTNRWQRNDAIGFTLNFFQAHLHIFHSPNFTTLHFECALYIVMYFEILLTNISLRIRVKWCHNWNRMPFSSSSMSVRTKMHGLKAKLNGV